MIKGELVYAVCKLSDNNCSMNCSFVRFFDNFSDAYDYLIDIRRFSYTHYFIRKFKYLGFVNG